jgi:hypothetical protein
MLRTMIARCRQLAPALAHVIRDRQGATMVVFALAGTAVIGMVGLGTEGGSWYLSRRDAQNAADAAAYAGAARLSLAQSGLSLSLTSARTQARDAANDTATLNGFTMGARAPSSWSTRRRSPRAPIRDRPDQQDQWRIGPQPDRGDVFSDQHTAVPRKYRGRLFQRLHGRRRCDRDFHRQRELHGLNTRLRRRQNGGGGNTDCPACGIAAGRPAKPLDRAKPFGPQASEIFTNNHLSFC